MTRSWRLLLPLLALSCGYRSVYPPEGERLHEKVVRMLVPDAVACDEVASGVREELARGGSLDAGEGYPRVEIEVLRGGEASEGVAAVGGDPQARATDVSLTARAWIVRAAGGQPERDTGDVRADEAITIDERGGGGAPPNHMTGQPDPRADLFHIPEARRAAARRLGRKLAERLLGLPSASEEAAP
jgi:hypothetical protein